MSKELYKALILAMLLAACVAIGLLLPAQAAPPPMPLTDDFTAGMGEKPTGQVVAGTCFTLTFSKPTRWVLLNNQTGADAYYIPNDAGCAAGSSYYDHVLNDGEDAFYNGWLVIEHLTVYVTPTAGFTVTGWVK